MRPRASSPSHRGCEAAGLGDGEDAESLAAQPSTHFGIGAEARLAELARAGKRTRADLRAGTAAHGE
jgi:hypothetical protein